MSIYYRSITTSVTEPSAPQNGDMWIAPIGSSTYQVYVYIYSWKPVVSGGYFATETDADTHYITAVVQNAPPDSFIQQGWLWVCEIARTVYLFMGGVYVPIAS